MSVGVAIIGCGLIGRKRASALPSDSYLVSLFDIDRARSEQLARVIGGSVGVSATPRDAIATDGVDLVVVATPHSDLTPIALEAISHQRSVLVEKPGGSSLQDLLELREAAAENRCRVHVGFNHRFHPALLKARELLLGGRYGALIHLRARYGHGGRLGYEREWRADRNISGGGELVDQGIHLIDLARFVAGDVELAFAELRTSFWPMEVEDNAFLALRSDAGAFVWLHASWTEWKNLFSFELVLERAKIEISGLGGSYGPETLRLYEMAATMGPPFATTWEWPQGDESWARELDDVLSSMEHDHRATAATLNDAVAAFRVVDDAYNYSSGGSSA